MKWARSFLLRVSVLRPENSGINTYGYGEYPNVVTSIEFERLDQRHGPEPGEAPAARATARRCAKIAWLQCVGSRNLHVDADYCSSICCMFAIKEALLAKERSGGDVDTAIFYMDMRTFGKDFQRYRDRAEKGLRCPFCEEPGPFGGAGGQGWRLCGSSYTDVNGAMQ